MVSNGQLVGMILAVTIPVMVVIVLFLQIKRDLAVKGLVFTACYGLLGYLWEAWIYVMAYGWIGAMIMQNTWFESGFGVVTKQVIIAVLYAILATLGLVWAIYLANMRDMRVERGPAVGLGFGLSYAVWNYVLVYGAPLIYGFQMRFGGFNQSEETRERVIGLPVENMYLFILDTVLFIMIVVATALVMGDAHQKGARLKMIVIPLVSQFAIKFLDTLLPTLLPDMVSAVIYHVIMCAAAIWSGWILYHYLKTKEVRVTR